MKYIKTYEKLIKHSDSRVLNKLKIFENQKFEEGDIVVAVKKDYPLIIGHRYIVYRHDGKLMSVKDIVNNEPIRWKYKDSFVTEDEWERIQIEKDASKYNL